MYCARYFRARNPILIFIICFFFSLKFQFWFSFISLLKDSTFKLANLEINYDYKLFVIKSTIEMICALSAVLPAFLANEY